MSKFSFGGINVSSKKQSLNLKDLQDIVLLDKSNYTADYDFVIAILTDEAYSPFQVRAIDTMLKKFGITKYIMLSALNCDITREGVEKEQSEGVIKFYKNHRSNYEKYIQNLLLYCRFQ